MLSLHYPRNPLQATSCYGCSYSLKGNLWNLLRWDNFSKLKPFAHTTSKRKLRRRNWSQTLVLALSLGVKSQGFPLEANIPLVNSSCLTKGKGGGGANNRRDLQLYFLSLTTVNSHPQQKCIALFFTFHLPQKARQSHSLCSQTCSRHSLAE